MIRTVCSILTVSFSAHGLSKRLQLLIHRIDKVDPKKNDVYHFSRNGLVLAQQEIGPIGAMLQGVTLLVSTIQQHMHKHTKNSAKKHEIRE